MKRVFKILLFLSPILLCGCLGIIFGIYVGCYSRIDLSFADTKVFAVEKTTIQNEADKALKQLNLPLHYGTLPLNIETSMLYRENLSQTNCVAQWWLQGKQSFWSGGQYSVQMFLKDNAISFVIITDEQGDQKELKKIQTAITKMVVDEFPNVQTNVAFRSLRTAMPP
jgi:hypothetical protein